MIPSGAGTPAPEREKAAAPCGWKASAKAGTSRTGAEVEACRSAWRAAASARWCWWCSPCSWAWTPACSWKATVRSHRPRARRTRATPPRKARTRRGASWARARLHRRCLEGGVPRERPRYDPPRLVLFSDAVRSACGVAGAAVGPFYCPADQQGLHRPRLLPRRCATARRARRLRPGLRHRPRGRPPRAEPARHRRAGAALRQRGAAGGGATRSRCGWSCRPTASPASGRTTRDDARSILEPGDVEEGLGAAAAIGDDRLQKPRAGPGRAGVVHPRQFRPARALVPPRLRRRRHPRMRHVRERTVLTERAAGRFVIGGMAGGHRPTPPVTERNDCDAHDQLRPPLPGPRFPRPRWRKPPRRARPQPAGRDHAEQHPSGRPHAPSDRQRHGGGRPTTDGGDSAVRVDDGSRTAASPQPGANSFTEGKPAAGSRRRASAT